MEPSPFRDDVAAAHARADRLEAENVALREQLKALEASKAPRPIAAPRMILPLLAICVAVLLAGLLFVALAVRHRGGAEEMREHRGIATATAPPAVQATTTASGNRAACQCQPGDPLCSCF
jgi:hypothetical protein